MAGFLFPPIACPRATAGLLAGVFWASSACQQLPASATSSSSAPTDETDTDTDTGTGDVDDGSLPQDPVFECDPVRQNCDKGLKCTPVERTGQRNYYTCVADDGNIDAFGSCQSDAQNGIDGCKAGFVCLDDVNDQGVCLRLCLDHNDCNQALCILDPFDKVPYCADECNPITPLCPDQMDCRRQHDRFACEFPQEDDDGTVRDPCVDEDRLCAEGLTCIPGALVPGCRSQGCCTPVCDTAEPGAAAECAAVLGSPAVTCEPLFSSPAPGFDTLGACLVPA